MFGDNLDSIRISGGGREGLKARPSQSSTDVLGWSGWGGGVSGEYHQQPWPMGWVV